MELEQLRQACREGRLVEAILEPADDANGWLLRARDADGAVETLTDDHGTPRVYHQLDSATVAAKELGFARIHVEERF